jgi:LysM repeat protein
MISFLTIALLSAVSIKAQSLCRRDGTAAFHYNYFNSMANNNIADFDEIEAGQIFKLPQFTYLKKNHQLGHTVTVQDGDSLWEISQRYYFNFQYLNPRWKGVSLPTVVGKWYYQVQAGDYLYKIAKQYAPKHDSTKALNDLVELNFIENPDEIEQGQLLKFPKYFSAPTEPRRAVKIVPCIVRKQ